MPAGVPASVPAGVPAGVPSAASAAARRSRGERALSPRRPSPPRALPAPPLRLRGGILVAERALELPSAASAHTVGGSTTLNPLALPLPPVRSGRPTGAADASLTRGVGSMSTNSVEATSNEFVAAALNVRHFVAACRVLAQPAHVASPARLKAPTPVMCAAMSASTSICEQGTDGCCGP